MLSSLVLSLVIVSQCPGGNCGASAAYSRPFAGLFQRRAAVQQQSYYTSEYGHSVAMQGRGGFVRVDRRGPFRIFARRR